MNESKVSNSIIRGLPVSNIARKFLPIGGTGGDNQVERICGAGAAQVCRCYCRYRGERQNIEENGLVVLENLSVSARLVVNQVSLKPT